MRVSSQVCPPSSVGGSCRLAPLLAVVMLLFVLVSGCVGQQDPTSYSDSVRENFIEGCTDGYVSEQGEKDPEAAEHRKLCTCIYDEMSNEKTGIPFSEFSDAQSKIRDDPTDPANSLEKLIPEFDGFVEECKAKSVAGPTGDSAN